MSGRGDGASSKASAGPGPGGERAPPRVSGRAVIHKGKKYDFLSLTVELPSGKTLVRDVVHHPGAVVIVPVLPDGRLVLIRVYRAAIDRWSFEFCAGTLEKDEAPQTCAGRELVEETGYKAGTLAPLGWFYTSPGMSDERMHAFVGTDLTHVGQDLEDDENIVVETVSVADMARLVDAGEVHDGKSLVAYYHARSRGHFGKGA
jgi:ADP-ribose pyrophosphatase